MEQDLTQFSYIPPAFLTPKESLDDDAKKQPNDEESKEVFPRMLISNKEIQEKFEISQPTLWRWTKHRGFPKAIKENRRVRPYQAVIAWAIKNGIFSESDFESTKIGNEQ